MESKYTDLYISSLKQEIQESVHVNYAKLSEEKGKRPRLESVNKCVENDLKCKQIYYKFLTANQKLKIDEIVIDTFFDIREAELCK